MSDCAASAAGNNIEGLQNRLRRVEGQIRGIQRMLDEGRVCEDVLTQLMAIRSGVEQVSILMLDHHLSRCVLTEMTGDSAKLEDLRRTLQLWMRLAPVPQD